MNLTQESRTRVTHNALLRPNVVSVIIPCYNHARFLGEAIESVLAQSYCNFEIIVVDDGSTDNTAEVAKRYSRIRYISQENAGLASARNTGLQQSRGEFLIFLDADDRLLANALETGVACMREHPECAFVSGRCRILDEGGAILASPRQLRVERDHYLHLLSGGSYIWCPATVLYRRSVFDFVRGFEPELSPAADYDLYLRVTRDFPVYCHGYVVAEYRQHSSNMSRDASKMERAALAAHEAQWDFVKANGRFKKAYDAGRRFLQTDYPHQKMVTRIREIVREKLSLNASIAVATSGNPELLRLDGRRAWHFPREMQNSKGQLFAQAARGSVRTPPWIEAGMTYEFSLYGGPEFSTLLARLLVRGVADHVDESAPEERLGSDGAALKAMPNPVPVGEEPGVTNICWNTGDGSEGQVYVSGEGLYAGHDPANSAEAWRALELEKANGAQYLIVPAKSFWWGDHCKQFRENVESSYPALVRDESTCLIFDLRELSR